MVRLSMQYIDSKVYLFQYKHENPKQATYRNKRNCLNRDNILKIFYYKTL